MRTGWEAKNAARRVSGVGPTPGVAGRGGIAPGVVIVGCGRLRSLNVAWER